MKAGMYEARSLDHPERVAYVVLDDASALRLNLHRARSALRVLRWHVPGSMTAVIGWALRDVEEGA